MPLSLCFSCFSIAVTTYRRKSLLGLTVPDVEFMNFLIGSMAAGGHGSEAVVAGSLQL